MIGDSEEIVIRLARRSDSEALLRLHDDPANRVYTLTPGAKTSVSEHEEWFNGTYRSGGENRCYVLDRGGVVGVCRIDGCCGEYEVSITIDSSCHGKRYGTILLAGAIDLFHGVDCTMTAIIHRNNVPSQRLFMKNGFIKSGKVVHDYYEEYISRLM